MGAKIYVVDPTTNEWMPYSTPFATIPAEDNFVLGVTKPIGTSILPYGLGGNVGTGVIRPAPTTHVYGDVNLSNASPTVQDRIIHGRVYVSSGVTVPWLVENCEILGPATEPTTAYGIVNTSNAGAAGIVRFCRIHPDVMSNWIDGIRTRRYTSYRNEIYNCVDGHGSLSTQDGHNDTFIWGNHCHSSAHMIDPGQSNGFTHCDTGVQVQGGDRWEIIGNNFEGFVVLGDAPSLPSGSLSTSCIMLNTGGAPRNLLTGVIRSNWLNGGVYQINGGAVSTSNGNVTITDNLFGRQGYQSGSPPFTGDATATLTLKTSSSSNVWTGAYPTNTTNVYEDNGHLITVRTV